MRLLDGHAMVGPVLGQVRERLLAAPALDCGTVRGHGGDPYHPRLIRLLGRGGAIRLPRFQFSRGADPWPAVLEVNGVLDAAGDPWGAADWWLSPNAWLGDVPERLLGAGRDGRLTAAAEYLAEGE